ncbi:PaaI family thioesterase [Gammaproteobacteria bacterium]|nr:PaaI family thioesterase [Gammaproteobacteria bacterium]
MVALRDKPIFLKPGHNAGDLVEAHKWTVLREEKGVVEVDAHLPKHLLNPRDQLFGGFHGTYVDMMSIYAARSMSSDVDAFRWSTTINMRIDYFAPVEGDRFFLKSEVIKNGRSTLLVSTTFSDAEGSKLAYAITTIKKEK